MLWHHPHDFLTLSLLQRGKEEKAPTEAAVFKDGHGTCHKGGIPKKFLKKYFVRIV